jgi:cytochrome c oxidase assembly factor CtaG
MTTTRELLLHAWTWRPILAGVLAAGVGLHLGLVRLRHPARTLALGGAVLAVVLALMSPIEALARGTLFSAHMLQHLLLVLAAPPLALLSLPRRSREAPRHRVPAFAYWALGVGAMWVWHVPTLCNAVATSGPARALQTVSLLAMGTAFWWPILAPRLEQRLSDLPSIAYLFTACLACSLLGITITFAPVEVCSAYLQPTDPLGVLPLVRGGWGLTPALDQQLGGLLMWVPGCAVYASAILAVLARFLVGSPPRVRTEGGAS